MKLRSRLAVTLGALVVPLALGVAAWSAWFRARTVRETLVEQLQGRMAYDGQAMCEGGPRRRRPRGRPFRGDHRPFRGPFAYDAAFRSSHPMAPRLPPALRAALLHDDVAEVAHPGGRGSLLAVRTPWPEGPCAILVVRHPAPPTGAVFRRAAIPALLVSLGAALLVVVAAGPIVRRIRQLTVQVRREEGPIGVGGHDEIAELAAAFDARRRELGNRMARIEAQDQALRRYVANTTHDVMTPVTVLQGHLAALDRAVRAGDAVDPEGVRGALEECHYLTALLRNLNVAAKLEAEFDDAEWAPFSLGVLVERVAARYRPMAEQASVQLEFAVPSRPVIVHGEVTLMEQAVGNLVQNAIHYNEPGGHVALVLDLQGARFSLTVADDGPGLDEADLAKLTRRGFRGARGRLKRPAGLGLGLGIARDVIERHGFEMTFSRPPEGGLKVQVEGPVADGLGERS